jgi:hypothetical protein
MSRFPPPTVKVLHITNGDTITVRTRLNAGESRAAYAKMMRTTPDGDLVVDRTKQPLALILAYLVDWSLADDAGHLVEIRRQPEEVVIAALDALDTDSYLEIKGAIEEHDREILMARLEQKKSQDGASESSATSPLPDGATGDTNGSPN